MSDPGPAPHAESRQDPIRVVPYDPAWPMPFERQSEPVAAVLRPWLTGPVERIGSTAVPGLPAKPIIDMLARITDYEAGREPARPTRLPRRQGPLHRGTHPPDHPVSLRSSRVWKCAAGLARWSAEGRWRGGPA